jgi:hypothetical protein
VWSLLRGIKILTYSFLEMQSLDKLCVLFSTCAALRFDKLITLVIYFFFKASEISSLAFGEGTS